MSAVAAITEQLEFKSRELHEIMEQGKTSDPQRIDLTKVSKITGTNEEKAAEIKRRNAELNELGLQRDLAIAAQKNAELQAKLNSPDPKVPSAFGGPQVKTVGERYTAIFQKRWRGREAEDGAGTNVYANFEDVDAKDYLATMEQKTLMTTTAGFAPQSVRTGVVIPAALRPVQVLDLIPQDTTTQAAVVFMEETTSTNAAAELAEAGSYAEDTFAYTERTSTVRKIAHKIPVTDEQLADIPQLQGILNDRMSFFLRQRLDLEVVTGNGVAPNLTGLLNTGSIQTQAKGADPTPDAVYKAMVKVRITGRASPSGIIMHPTDWQNVRLLRTADGIYIWGSPDAAAPERMWGLPVAQFDGGSAGTAYVADFVNFTRLFYRKGIEVQVGYVNDDFIKGQATLRADLRAAFVVYRPAAVCTVTGL